MDGFRAIEPKDLNVNPFTMIGSEWMLITAGTSEKCNTMTASWGSLGVLWSMPAATVYVRPTRYTLGFLDREKYFSLSVFDEKYRGALDYCGSHSGRDGDKIGAAGLTPAFGAEAPYFREAKTVFLCRKLYRQPFQPACFTDDSLDGKNYPNKDYHIMFVGGIEKILVKA